VNLPEEHIGVYVRGGAIVPILQHNRELSLLRAFNKPIQLEVYLSPGRLSAHGNFVLDDGLTLSRDRVKVKVDFSAKGILSLEIDQGSNFKSGKIISGAIIYGLPRIPKRVTCLVPTFCKDSLYDFYDKDALTVVGLNYEIPASETKPISLFKVEQYTH